MKQTTQIKTKRPFTLRETIMNYRNNKIVSVVNIYGRFVDKFPMGAVMNRGLSIRTGQCHVHRYLQPLYERIRNGDIDPSFVVTHRLGLDLAPDAYETFKHKQDECVKVVLKP